MCVFHNFSGVTPPGPPFGAVTQNQTPSLKNPGCAPGRGVIIYADHRSLLILRAEPVVLLASVHPLACIRVTWRSASSSPFVSLPNIRSRSSSSRSATRKGPETRPSIAPSADQHRPQPSIEECHGTASARLHLFTVSRSTRPCSASPAWFLAPNLFRSSSTNFEKFILLRLSHRIWAAGSSRLFFRWKRRSFSPHS